LSGGAAMSALRVTVNFDDSIRPPPSSTTASTATMLSSTLISLTIANPPRSQCRAVCADSRAGRNGIIADPAPSAAAATSRRQWPRLPESPWTSRPIRC
jgi:hypothetical protein